MPFIAPSFQKLGRYADQINSEIDNIEYLSTGDFDEVFSGFDKILGKLDTIIELARPILEEYSESEFNLDLLIEENRDILFALEKAIRERILEALKASLDVADSSDEESDESQDEFFTQDLPEALKSVVDLCDLRMGYVSPQHLPSFRDKLAEIFQKRKTEYATLDSRAAYIKARLRDFIDRELKKLVFESLKDFDLIFAELDKIAKGEASRLVNLEEAIAKFCNPAENRALIAEQIAAFKAEFLPNAERTAEQALKLREDIVSKTLRMKKVAPYPSPADAELMQAYDIARTTQRAELDFSVHLARTVRIIDRLLPGLRRLEAGEDIEIWADEEGKKQDYDAIIAGITYAYETLQLRLSWHKILPAFNAASLDAVANNLENMREAIDGSRFTLQELLRDFNASTRSFLIKNIFEIIAHAKPALVDRETLNEYVRLKKLLSDLEADIEYRIYPNMTNVLHTLRREVPAFNDSAETEEIDVPDTVHANIRAMNKALQEQGTVNNTGLAILRFKINVLEHIVFNYQVHLSEVWGIHKSKLTLVLKNKSTFNRILTSAELSIIDFLRDIPATTLNKLIQHLDAILKICEDSRVSFKELVRLPADDLDLLLTGKNLYRMHMLLDYYWLPQEVFFNASNAQKRAWLQNPSSAVAVFNQEARALDLPGLVDALGVIQTMSNATLPKLKSSKIYMDEFSYVPEKIILELKSRGLGFRKCRTLYRCLFEVMSDFSIIFYDNYIKDNVRRRLAAFDTEVLRGAFTEIEIAVMMPVLNEYVDTLQNVLDAPRDYAQDIERFFPEIFKIVAELKQPQGKPEYMAKIADLAAELRRVFASVQPGSTTNSYCMLIHFLTHSDIGVPYDDMDEDSWRFKAANWHRYLRTVNYEDGDAFIDENEFNIPSEDEADVVIFNQFYSFMSCLYNWQIRCEHVVAQKTYVEQYYPFGDDRMFLQMDARAKYAESAEDPAPSFKRMLDGTPWDLYTGIGCSIYGKAIAHFFEWKNECTRKKLDAVIEHILDRSFPALYRFLVQNKFMEPIVLHQSFVISKGFSRAQLNKYNADGYTPLTKAIALGQESIVLALLVHGADHEQEDRNGNWPFDMALELDADRIIKDMVFHSQMKNFLDVEEHDKELDAEVYEEFSASTGADSVAKGPGI